MPDWLAVVIAIASPVFSAGGAYAAVRVRLEWLRRDVDHALTRADEAHRRIRELEISTRRLLALGR